MIDIKVLLGVHLMETERGLLRIGISGQWEASEFSQSLAALDRLYALRFGLYLEKQELYETEEFADKLRSLQLSRMSRLDRRYARQAFARSLFHDFPRLVVDGRISEITQELLEPSERLIVRRLIYGSPGIKDLAGIGEIIGHLKDFLQFGIEHWSGRRKRSLEDDHQELENRKLEIELAKGYVELADSLGYSAQEKRQLIAAVVFEQRPIISLISSNKIISAEMADDL